MLQARYTVAEGVSKFLFYLAKRGNHADLHELVKEEQWYKESFLCAIFSIEDELINNLDVAEIRRRFFDAARDATEITCALIYRFDGSLYRHLNIRLLFEVFDKLSREQFQTFVVPIFESSYQQDAYWPIEQLAKDLVDLVGKCSNDDLHRASPLFELLLYLLPVRGVGCGYPARTAVVTLLDSKPELISLVLLPKLKAISQVYSPYHWDMLGDLLRGGQELPVDVCEAAAEVWRTVHDSNGRHVQTRVSLEQCFRAAHRRKVWDVPDDILDQLEEVKRDRIR